MGAPSHRNPLDRAVLLNLQATAGNAAVSGLLARPSVQRNECCSGCKGGGACDEEQDSIAGRNGASGTTVQRELLTYHQSHTEVLPSAGLSETFSTETFSGESARVKAALQLSWNGRRAGSRPTSSALRPARCSGGASTSIGS